MMTGATDEESKSWEDENMSPVPMQKKDLECEMHCLLNYSDQRNGKISKDDFNLISVIGKGAYGKVLLVKKKSNQTLYAMKILKKNHLRELK